MKRLEDLIPLEKRSTVEIRYCDIIADKTNEEENTRTRILFDSFTGKYYFHQMQNGEITKCFEIALSWRPFGKVDIFCFSPDDLHIYEIDSGAPDKFKVLRLTENLITPGMAAGYDGLTVEYAAEDELRLNGKSVKVTPDSDYTYKLMKTKICASGGAKGLFCFLENCMETSRLEEPDIQIGKFTMTSHEKSWLACFKAYAAAI